MNEPLLSVENLRVAYRNGQPQVVEDVSFWLNPGERLGLVGESGCGKSTLGRAVMRLLPDAAQVEGRVKFQGQSVFDLDGASLRRFRGEAVAIIFQDPMTRLDPLMTIGDHCIETLKAHEPGLSTRSAKERAIATLEAVNIPENRWSQFPHEFSGGMRQRVAIALALLLNPKLIVADEPTTSLDVTVSAQILQELTRLCSERNMALIVISHDLAMIGQYCDRIAVMYNGKIVETGNTASVFSTPQHGYTQTLLNSALLLQAEQDISIAKTNPILKLHDLKQHYTIERNFFSQIFDKRDFTIRAVDGIDLELFAGETLGLVGESGCGKSTLSRTILQLLRPTSGSVTFQGQELTTLGRQQLQQQRRQIQMIFQDPHACLNPRMTIAQIVADPLLVHGLATPEKAKQDVEFILERVGLNPAEFAQRYAGELSGGQQQRVAIARALITRPKLVICDEPVSMLDATVRTQVLDLMQALKDEFELTYLFITHDLWVARYFCDRIAVMNGGKILELGMAKEVFSHPQHPYTQTLLGAAPLLAQMSVKPNDPLIG
ncbi:dipeptide ABC transporter ATP-binding protein [Myxacorys almedinensis]|uniref:Dipeptide ABC transporter ATP-binding protein n=1 Tax=Myxacorys almedinensis A TaxID=2690445 RepID=A0A8J7Z195_9CYAN|nr:ABC transporter ATP-binding protein [Myxacorys almedinensis]NDJ16321.1 dipeptide ABC transporter ATP-binding protein [Myxacorys almedinensis A]